MLVKSDVFFWICTECNHNGDWCFDQGQMTEEESRADQAGENEPDCPVCGGVMTTEVW
ncbi:hypothetical protein ES703_104676 [subsurface metagenome]